MEKTKRLFREGDEVAHKENIGLKLQVIKVVRKKKVLSDNKTRDFVLGIQCGWWDGDTYAKEIFHTNHLVPWSIAEAGYVSVIRYLNEKHNITA